MFTLTASMNKKVNLFLVGAAKAGTTSLQSYLNQHPQIFFSPLKEPNYFAKDIDTNLFSKAYKMRNDFVKPDYFKQSPLPEHHISFIGDLDNYHKLFKDASNEMFLGDASTSYLYSALAANEIKQYNVDARIVIMLRSPIDRAYSHYSMALQGGYTNLSLLDAIKKDQKAEHKGFGISELFIELGMYAKQLERYYATFPSNQIKVFFYDEFTRDSNGILNNVFEWLEIDKLAVNVDAKKNISMQPKSKKWNKILSDSGIKKAASALLPDHMKIKLKRMYYSANKNSLSEKEKAFLLKIYKEDIVATEKLINKNLADWKRL